MATSATGSTLGWTSLGALILSVIAGIAWVVLAIKNGIDIDEGRVLPGIPLYEAVLFFVSLGLFLVAVTLGIVWLVRSTRQPNRS